MVYVTVTQKDMEFKNCLKIVSPTMILPQLAKRD